LFTVTNFFLTYSTIWSFTYFFVYTYIFFIFSVVLYVLSGVKDFLSYSAFNKLHNFSYLSGFDLIWLLFTPLALLLLVNFSWTSPVVSLWFGHLVFTSLQYKFVYLVIFIFTIVLLVYSSVFFYSSQEVYDYILVIFSFFLWVLFLFFASNIFTFIFFIEILSTLITLILVTSVFSSGYFYNTLSLNNSNYFNSTTPFAFLQTLMFFFWVSLVSSLNLFIFLTLFYIKFLTFDWFLVESVFYYIITISNVKSTFFVVLAWFNFMFCIFLKCGLVPFYFWKPVFFKGIPLHALFFYIVFFYFFIFLFIIYLLIVYLNNLFYFSLLVNIVLVLLGILILITILCESYLIKVFLAMSSILNSLLVFLAMSSFSTIDMLFYI